MGLFKRKHKLPLHDLVKYEALLKNSRANNAPVYPRLMPGDPMGKVDYAADELKQIKDNQDAADQLWRRYSGRE